MLNYLLKIIIIINYFNIYYSYTNSIYCIIDKNFKKTRLNSYHDDKYLNLKPKTITLQLPDERKCSICKTIINIKLRIPENCTIPEGCPFNRKKNNNEDEIYKFKG